MTESNSSSDARAKLIETVQTPLGFFSLVVLIVEVILGISANLSSGKDKTYLIIGMLGLIFLLVLIVTVMALYQPTALYGKKSIQKSCRYPGDKELISNVEVVKNPKILLASGVMSDLYLGNDVFMEDATIIRRSFPKADLTFKELTANDFRRLLTQNKFDIIQISVNVSASQDLGDVRLYFSPGNLHGDFMPSDGFVELLEISETKLVIIASCNSVPLAAKLSTKVNMIASSHWLEVEAFNHWQQVFYQLLSQEVPLSRAYSIATSTVRLSMAMLMKQDIVFSAKKSKIW